MSTWIERWWRGEAGAAGTFASAATLPAELAFRAAAAARDAAYSHALLHSVRVSVPVVSIGNLTVGGAGKTPFAAFIARRLADTGHAPALLHGGYADDEPMLHRRWNPDIPVYAGRERAASARHAIAQGATVLILDDGFQHRRLERDVDFVLVAAETWTSAPRLLPRGPWREAPRALRRATAIVITERTGVRTETRARIRREIQLAAPNVPVCVAALQASGWRRGAHPGGREPLGTVPREPTLAVAGIAHPELFVRAARSAGAQIDDVMAFRDHHAYTAHDARAIATRAAGRSIVTTAKDWIKLESMLDGTRVWILEQQVAIEEGGAILDALLANLQSR